MDNQNIKIKNHRKPGAKLSQNKIRPSMRKDVINPVDYRLYNRPWACEDCSHFSSSKRLCTIGYPVENHLRENMLKMYETSGAVNLCRFIEID